MSKSIGKIGLWLVGLICMIFVCVKMIRPITETELINSENYLITPELKAGDVIEQTVTLQKKNLKAIEVAFVFEEDTQEVCKALVEIMTGEKVLTQSVVQVNLLPNMSLTPFEVSGADIGDELTLRITNISEEGIDNPFSLLYTDSRVRMLGHVTLFEINGQKQQGQLITQYVYRTGYEFYGALSVVFFLFLMCMTLETAFFKKQGGAS